MRTASLRHLLPSSISPLKTIQKCLTVRLGGWLRPVLLALAFVLGSAQLAAAQEVQLSFDRAGTIQVLDAQRAERMGLFVDEYPGFQEARLFQAGDSVRLEILSRRDGTVIRTTRILSPAQLGDLRDRLAMPPAAVAVAPSANARTLLLASSTLLGLTVYGPALPIAFDVDDTKSATALYMATASASFFIPWILTSNVTPAMAQAGYYGSTRGFLHGAALHYLIAGGDDDDCNFEDCTYVRNTLASGVLGGVAEGVAGYLWARNTNMTGGEANATSLGGDWGLLNGFGLAVVTGISDEGSNEDDHDRATTTLGLAGAAGGMGLGRILSEDRDYTYGDVEVMSTAGLLGTYVGWAIADEASGRQKAEMAATMAGSIVGIAIGDRLVADNDFTYGQAALVRLGTLAGGLLGAGTGVLLESESSSHTALTTALGGLAGFFATQRVVERSARAALAANNLEINVAPLGVASLLAPDQFARESFAIPVASVRYRF